MLYGSKNKVSRIIFKPFLPLEGSRRVQRWSTKKTDQSNLWTSEIALKDLNVVGIIFNYFLPLMDLNVVRK